ncbi:Zinc metalloproteinase nas-7 [Papilio xuthus]|uniref:Zinc metalloproteinase nas-7 n=1 Tax=Papilio xuthus TaxID=66420 RepID=A0A194Q0K2_PAPXU|nr:Zinc metalloproteinase nas-7 [Papilio xuthus]
MTDVLYYIVDKKLIQRKRQDTLDMCRIFNEETARLEQYNSAKKLKTNEDHSKQHVRSKRNVESLNPTVKVEDIRRVEGIVDKLYDDMDGNGKVTYRQRRFDSPTTGKSLLNTTARRFNFAPAELLGPPSKQDGPTNHDEAEKMPWHKKWKQGIVPYFIDPNTYDSQLSETIIKAFDYFEKASCIRLQRLRERPTDKLSLQNVEWLYISNPYGIKQCVHSNERKVNSGVQSNIKIGQRDGLSETDIEKIGMVYGHECVERNRQYLLKTCPSVVKVSGKSKTATQDEIEKYFEDRLWPYGIIHYKMRDKLEFSAEERENIKAVIRHIEKETCIQFRELQDNDEPKQTTAANQNDIDNGNNNTSPIMYSFRPTPEISDNEIKDNDETTTKPISTKVEDKEDLTSTTQPSDVVIEISTLPTSRRHAANLLILSRSSEPGCHCPSPGRPNGNKDLKINADCFNSVNELLHLFVHVLGLDHQHNMHDRDSFIHIVWSNLTEEIEQEMQQKLPPAAAAGFPYDYLSVMHYPWLHIKNGVTSIMYPIWNDGWSMGHWQGLSATDVRKLNLIYAAQCSQRKEYENGSDDDNR